jgi:hypothetical protein
MPFRPETTINRESIYLSHTHWETHWVWGSMSWGGIVGYWEIANVKNSKKCKENFTKYILVF